MTDNTYSMIIMLNSIYKHLKFSIFVKYSWKLRGNQLSTVECNHKALMSGLGFGFFFHYSVVQNIFFVIKFISQTYKSINTFLEC